MDPIQAIVLGIVQGLTEFIPISSSAHLLVIPWLFHWRPSGLVFDVALHLGTFLALLIYFWRDWYDILKPHISATRMARVSKLQSAPGEAMLLWPIVIACIPAGLAGALFNEQIEHGVRENLVLVGVMTTVLGLLLLVADRLKIQRRPMETIGMRDWLIIGIAQALAIIPGVSRSGITITAGLFCGLDREASTRFSFLLGAPVIFGAAAYEMRHLLSGGLGGQLVPFLVGVIAATIVGYLCIGFLLGYLKKRGYALFAVYRFIFGGVVIALSLLHS